MAGIALTPGTAAQLPVDPACLVALRSDDHEAARWILVALELFDLLGRQVGRFDLLAERRLTRLDAADLTLLDARAEFDVGAAAGHVRRDRDRAGLPRLRDNLRLALVILGVQDLVLEPAALQQARQRLRNLDIGRPDQHWQAALMLALDLLHDRVVLLFACLVDEVVLVDPADGPICRNYGHVELVDLVELGFFRLRRARHARELLVHAEVVLDRDRGESLGLFTDGHTFLRFHRLVQPIRPAPARHQASREFVHDEDLALLHDVLDVFFVQRVRLQQLVDDVQRLALDRVLRLHHAPPLDLFGRRQLGVVLQLVDGVRDIGHHEQRGILRGHRFDAFVGQVHRAATLVHDEIQIVFDVAHLLVARGQLAVGEAVELDPLHLLLDALLVQQLQQLLVLRHAELRLIQQLRALVTGIRIVEQRLGLADQIVRDRGLLTDELHDLCVELRVLLVRFGAHGPGDDQRRARLVDQDRVHFVDDPVHVAALDPLLQTEDHVVAQVVETEFVVGAVRDVAQVGRAPLRSGRLRVVDAPHRQTEPLEEMPHPL